MTAEAQKTTPATFRDGFPTNLSAASLDALEWLQAFRRMHPPSGESKGRLDRAIECLERELRPCLPEVDLDCKCWRCAREA